MPVAVKKPRLLIVHERYGRMAGAEQNIFVTLPFLARHFEVSFLYWTRTGRDETTLDRDCTGYQVDFAAPAADLRPAVAEVAEAVRPDVVYVHKCLSLPLLEELLHRGLPLVRMEHDHDIYCMRSYKYFPLSRRICTRRAGLCCLFPCLAFVKRDREAGLGIRCVDYFAQMRQIRVNRRFSAFFVVTTYMRDELIRQGFAPEKIAIMPPVPVPEPQCTRSTFGPRNLILFIGQIIRGKGLDCLLRSLARVQTPFELAVMGDGSQRRFCERLAADLGLAERVNFHGFVGRDIMDAHYREATLVAVPSVWPEPIATVGLEALRRAVPVVGFDAGGIGDWLRDGKTGVLVPWMDLDAMAVAIERLLGDKAEARRLGRQGREFVDEAYDFNAYTEELVKRLQLAAGLEVNA